MYERAGRRIRLRRCEAGAGLERNERPRDLTARLGLSPERLYDWTGRFKDLLRLRMVKAMPFPGMKEAMGRLGGPIASAYLPRTPRRWCAVSCAATASARLTSSLPMPPYWRRTSPLPDSLRTGTFGAGETLYIGDEVRDIDACRKTGIRIISVTWGFNSKEALCRKNPDFLVDSAGGAGGTPHPSFSTREVLFPRAFE